MSGISQYFVSHKKSIAFVQFLILTFTLFSLSNQVIAQSNNYKQNQSKRNLQDATTTTVNSTTECQKQISFCLLCQKISIITNNSNQISEIYQYKCKKCTQPLLLSPDFKKCANCSSVISNCQKCQVISDGSARCLLCKGEMKLGLSGKSCQTSYCQINNCSQCKVDINGYFYCVKCTDNFHLNDQNTQCLKCSDIHSKCTTCGQQQISSNIQTNDTFLSPLYKTICLSCSQGLFLNRKGQEDFCDFCQNIIDNCIKCMTIHQNPGSNIQIVICSTCKIGFIVQFDKNTSKSQCMPCYKGCLQCSQAYYNCSSCKQGYTFYQNTCYQNQPSILNYGGSCKFSNGSIVSCGVGCSFCTCSQPNNIYCLISSKGYTVYNYQTLKCPEGCKTCSFPQINQCVQCYQRFVMLSNKTCKLCSSKCGFCSTAGSGICSKCPQGFFLNGQVCNRCIDKCSQCQNKTVCLKCNTGYYYSWNTNTCQQCVRKCGSCSSNNITKCESCPLGYFLNQNSYKCQSCKDKCIKCFSNITCQKCIQGYELNVSGICKKSCKYPCLQCTENDSTFCISCFSGFQLQKSSQNKLTCQKVSDCNGLCPMCPFQTRFNGIKCESCNIYKCLSCQSDISQCQTCLPGYYKSDRFCKQCPNSCQTCLNDIYCLTCNQNYVKIRIQIQPQIIMGGVCQKCLSPCQTCIQTIDHCLTCISGYQKIGTKCYYTDKLLIVIAFDITPSKFMAEGKAITLQNLILKQAGQFYQKNKEMFSYTQIHQGSTIVYIQLVNPLKYSDSRLSVLPPQPCQQASNIKSFLSKNAQISGMKILSSMISIKGSQCLSNNSRNYTTNFNQNQSTIQNKTINDNNQANFKTIPDYTALLWIVLSFVIVLLILFFFLVIIVVYCFCRRGKINITELLDGYRGRKKEQRFNNQIQITQQNLNDNVSDNKNNKKKQQGKSRNKQIPLQQIQEIDVEEDAQTDINRQQQQSYNNSS